MNEDLTQIAKQASDNASVAAKAAVSAAESATSSAVTLAALSTDVGWLKKTLVGIEETLNEMSKAFVTAVQHAEVIKRLDDHETRLNHLEGLSIRQTAMLVIGSGILSVLVGLLVYHIAGSK